MRIAEPVEPDRTVRGNLLLLGLRLLLALVSLAVLLLRQLEGTRPDASFVGPIKPADPLYLQPEGLVVIIVLALTVLYGLLLQRKELAPKIAVIQLTVDIGLISALVYDTGGAQSPFTVFYLIALAAAALVVRQRVVLGAAGLAAVCFSAIAVFYSSGYIPSGYAENAPQAQLELLRSADFFTLLRLHILPIVAIFFVAALAGRLAGRMEQTELLHAELLAGLDEGVLVLDQKRNVVYRNNSWDRLLGILQQPKDKNESISVAPLEGVIQSTFDQGFSHRTEFSWPRGDGSNAPLSARCYPITGGADPKERGGLPPNGVLVVLDDVSAQKKMEELMSRQERIEALGRLSASIAHEIRNPLASIRGAVQEVGRIAEIPDSKKDLIKIILDESDRLNRIISDFIRFTRMPAPRPRPNSPLLIVRELKTLLEAREDASGVSVVIDSEETPDFMADADQLRQALLNLGTNAMSAVKDQEEKRIVLRTRNADIGDLQGLNTTYSSTDKNRKGILFEVEDTGAGMAEEMRSRIFEPFYSTKGSGGGLGLAVVSRILQAHEGVASVHSEEGKGTTFRLWFPLEPLEENSKDNE